MINQQLSFANLTLKLTPSHDSSQEARELRALALQQGRARLLESGRRTDRVAGKQPLGHRQPHVPPPLRQLPNWGAWSTASSVWLPPSCCRRCCCSCSREAVGAAAVGSSVIYVQQSMHMHTLPPLMLVSHRLLPFCWRTLFPFGCPGESPCGTWRPPR